MKNSSFYLYALCFILMVPPCKQALSEEIPIKKEAKKRDWREVFDKAKWGEDSSQNNNTENDTKWLDDPFKSLHRDMQSAIHDLNKGDTNPPAKTTQPRIINRLDQLIAVLKKKRQQSKSSSTSKKSSSRPAESSTLAKGPGGQGKMRTPAKTGRNWAKLTPSQRKKILQSKTEGFPPGYEDVLADYFLRLTKNKSGNSSKPIGENKP